jgi:hypothetical protein
MAPRIRHPFGAYWDIDYGKIEKLYVPLQDRVSVAEIDCTRLGIKAFSKQAPKCIDATSGTHTGFEHCDCVALLYKLVGTDKTSDSRTNNNDVLRWSTCSTRLTLRCFCKGQTSGNGAIDNRSAGQPIVDHG